MSNPEDEAGAETSSGNTRLAILLAMAMFVLVVGTSALSVSFTAEAEDSSVLPPQDQETVAQTLERDAQIMSNTELEVLLAEHPEDIQDEIVRINTETRPRALQVALVIPILAALLGLANSLRMVRLPEPESTGTVEGVAFG